MLIPAITNKTNSAYFGNQTQSYSQPSPVTRKLKVLAWGDSAAAGTGFGVVSKHVLSAIHATGKYEIHHLAINHHGDFVDTKVIPWQMQPAKLMDPKDPHGMKMFMKMILKHDYDIIWILNDVSVLNEIAPHFVQLIDRLKSENRNIPKIIYYYPTDCHAPRSKTSFLPLVDFPVCYTDHGRAETAKTYPEILDKLNQIPHGVNSEVFKPLALSLSKEFKAKLLGVDTDPFLVITVNRNSARKQIPYSMLAFKEFKKRVPNSVMYVHANPVDQGGDLRRAAQDIGLNPTRDIIFPLDYSPSNPVSEVTLNVLYNMGDLFLTTHLGEGWGLTVTEAMAAGVPVIAPNNTCMPEQLGTNSERGYMYDCKDMIWIDPSGFRPKGLIPDIVNKMLEVYQAGPKDQNLKVKLARDWAVEHDWKKVHQPWVNIFDRASQSLAITNQAILGEVL